MGILQHAADQGVSLPLRLITTVSELVSDELRAMVGKIPGCKLVDRYATTETLLIAAECAQCGAYHAADRKLVVEVLDDNGTPVKPGKLGRVVVTSPLNLAMPLIRYDTGDFALLAKHSCPRSTVTLSHIVGRQINLFKSADGRRILPYIDSKSASEAGFRQFKLVQRSFTDIDLLDIPKPDRTEVPQERGQMLVDRHMGPGFKVASIKVDEMPMSPSGKYLMHECLF
jgi:phenylacetate-CoA ligase